MIGVGRSETRLKNALEAGLLTAIATSPEQAAAADVVIGCTPVNRLAGDLSAMIDACSDDAIHTDAGSVKGPLCRDLSQHTRFVGAHPLAGSEKSGWEHADADLFAGRTSIVTPLPTNDPTARATVIEFWTMIGMETVVMSPDDHDQAVAETSHLPHIAAAAVTRQLSPWCETLVAAGFRDTTRVAAGDAGMWAAIAEANARAITTQIDQLTSELGVLKQAITDKDEDAVRSWFAEAANIRNRLRFE